MFRKDKNSNIFRPDFFLFAFSKRDANFWERPPRILLCPVSKKTNLKIEKAKKNTIQECLTLLMFVGECNRRSTNRWQFNQPFDLAPASACWLLVNCLPDSKTTSTSTPTCCASRSRTRINRSLLARPQLSAFTFSCTFCFSQKQMRTCPLPFVVISLYFDFFRSVSPTAYCFLIAQSNHVSSELDQFVIQAWVVLSLGFITLLICLNFDKLRQSYLALEDSFVYVKVNYK